MGEVELTKWQNRINGELEDRSSSGRGAKPEVEIVAAMYPYLMLFNEAMKEEFKDTNGFRVNSGFRKMAHQERLRNKYEENLQKWKDEGSPEGEKPLPVAKAGRSNHQSGQAVDLAFYDTNWKRTALYKNRSLFRWMQMNGPTYGFDWSEGKRIGEPHHWKFNINQTPPIAQLLVDPANASSGDGAFDEEGTETPSDFG